MAFVVIQTGACTAVYVPGWAAIAVVLAAAAPRLASKLADSKG